ncbi:hypothetical protein, partial [Micromonospora sp. WMMD736]|uniref:hypothetical protein n=1 Tax=Micromonospora sp. WMMD736 TaxID=3404112 RepID=UPI003B939934
GAADLPARPAALGPFVDLPGAARRGVWLIVWILAGLLGMATGLRIGWAIVNKQSVVSSAMIVALGSLGLVAALNWQPLTLLIDDLLGWPNVAVGLSQVALVVCAAGSCVMITSAASERNPTITRRIAIAQYSVAAVISVLTLVLFFADGQQPEMSPEEYLRRNLGLTGSALPWLLPLLYVLLAMTLVVWAGLRHSSSSRRGRALFVFTVGIVLIVLASAFFLLRAVGGLAQVGVGAAATLLACAMLVVAVGSLLPTIEDWFGARRELAVIDPLLSELGRRQPDVGIGERPHGPLVFRVAERMSLISDALYLEAIEAVTVRDSTREAVEAGGGRRADEGRSEPGPDHAAESPTERARAIARWIYAGRGEQIRNGIAAFPGPNWLRQPDGYSDREWILAIAAQYRDMDRAGDGE